MQIAFSCSQSMKRSQLSYISKKAAMFFQIFRFLFVVVSLQSVLAEQVQFMRSVIAHRKSYVATGGFERIVM